MITSKKEKILTAAKGVFLRYGYKRVSMNDIAQAAGVSRPALYLVFKSKEEIFNGVFQQWVDETILEIENGMPALQTPKEKLRYAFEIWAVRPFELIAQSAEAKELMEGNFDFSQESFKTGYGSFEKLLVPAIKQQLKSRSSRIEITAEKTAHILVCALRGFKQTAQSAGELRKMIDDLLVLSLDN